MYCKNCGKFISDSEKKCPYCGGEVQVPTPVQPVEVVNKDDNGGFGWWILGFFVPLLGLILFIMFRKNGLPLRAKSIGIGALVGAIISFVIGFVLGILLLPYIMNYLNFIL